MASHADDDRYIASEVLGRTAQLAVPASSSTPLAEALTPGRYMIRILDFGTADVWVRQGTFGSVTAAAAVPSTRFIAHTDSRTLNLPLIYVIAKPGIGNGLAFFADGGTGATVQVTKISRDKA